MYSGKRVISGIGAKGYNILTYFNVFIYVELLKHYKHTIISRENSWMILRIPSVNCCLNIDMNSRRYQDKLTEKEIL